MGHIYAAAQLTIIAAAGEDPTYGLPGIVPHLRGNASFEKIGPITLSAVAFPEVCIAESRWSTRAWTFQEAFLSKRRLFFTDRHVVFACNTKTCRDGIGFHRTNKDKQWLLNWLPIQEKGGKHYEEPPMLSAKRLLKEYSMRNLSYEVDALNAIVGALNALFERSLYHVWGVPILHERDAQKPYKDNLPPDPERGHFAMLWYHDRPCQRRHSFPSWSSVGWTGPISWNSGWGINSHANDTTTASTKGIILRTGNTRHLLSSFAPKETWSSTRVSQLLEISTEAANLRLLLGERTPKSVGQSEVSENKDCPIIAFTFGKGVSIVVEPHWDVPKAKLEGLRFLKAILIHKSDSDAVSRGVVEDCVLLLKPTGDHYERIGLIWMDMEADEESWPPLHHGFTMCDKGFNILDDNDSRTLAIRRSYSNCDPWWRKLFRPETVLLG